MNLDLRIPMGLMFTFTGAIMTTWGIKTNGNAIYAKSLGINANLWWGLVLLAFGLTMFMLGQRSQRACQRATDRRSKKAKRGEDIEKQGLGTRDQWLSKMQGAAIACAARVGSAPNSSLPVPSAERSHIACPLSPAAPPEIDTVLITLQLHLKAAMKRKTIEHYEIHPPPRRRRQRRGLPGQRYAAAAPRGAQDSAYRPAFGAAAAHHRAARSPSGLGHRASQCLRHL